MWHFLGHDFFMVLCFYIGVGHCRMATHWAMTSRSKSEFFCLHIITNFISLLKERDSFFIVVRLFLCPCLLHLKVGPVVPFYLFAPFYSLLSVPFHTVPVRFFPFLSKRFHFHSCPVRSCPGLPRTVCSFPSMNISPPPFPSRRFPFFFTS